MAARQAGLTVSQKAVQLWQVGAGLPLDALKKGAIIEFTCPYKLETTEVIGQVHCYAHATGR